MEEKINEICEMPKYGCNDEKLSLLKTVSDLGLMLEVDLLVGASTLKNNIENKYVQDSFLYRLLQMNITCTSSYTLCLVLYFDIRSLLYMSKTLSI